MSFFFSSNSTGSGGTSDLFVFQYGAKRVLAERQLCYCLAIQTCRSLFPDLPRDCTITFNTKELDICKNEMTEISEQVWASVVRQLNYVVVMAEPTGSSSDGAAMSSPGAEPFSKRIVINVDYFGTVIRSQVSTSSQIAKLMGDVRSRMGEYPGGFTLAFNGGFLDRTKCIKDYSIRDGDTIQCHPLLLGRKPVIYLCSPTHIMEALVKLSLAAQWDFSAIYPAVPIKARTESSNEEISWKVEVHPNGDLTELTTGLDVAYLFWEAHTNSTVARPLTPPPSPGFGTSSTESVDIFYPNSANLSDSDSVVLSVDKITAYLDKALIALCLHTEARTSFITYWLPFLLKHKHVALRFIPQKAYEYAAPLTVSPAPDVVTRIFMVFKGLTDEELGRWSAATNRASEDVQMWQNIVGVDWERARDATLFRVLEWGGMEVF